MTKINKQSASRRLIASAVKGSFAQDDILAVHLNTMAAYDLLRGYADAKKIQLDWDLRDFIKEEHFADAMKNYFKKPYNFLKHADRDADAELDISNLEAINDVFLLWVAKMHHDCFKEWSKHQALFVNYMLFSHPELIKEGSFKELTDKNLKGMEANSRPEWMAAFKEVYRINDLAALEGK